MGKGDGEGGVRRGCVSEGAGALDGGGRDERRGGEVVVEEW